MVLSSILAITKHEANVDRPRSLYFPATVSPFARRVHGGPEDLGVEHRAQYEGRAAVQHNDGVGEFATREVAKYFKTAVPLRVMVRRGGFQ
jgi:hypothetical protein